MHRKIENHHTPSPPPPQGFSTWLDYAVACIDTRLPYLDQFATQGVEFDRDTMRKAAIAELDVLRSTSGVPDTFPKTLR